MKTLKYTPLSLGGVCSERDKELVHVSGSVFARYLGDVTRFRKLKQPPNNESEEAREREDV